MKLPLTARCPFNETVQVGDYSVSFIENDHDTIGSAGILIEAAIKNLHSGDVRKNGYHREIWRHLSNRHNQWIC